MTSPPTVIDDLVVVGSAIDDNQRTAMPAGVVRAFDTRTGGLRWSWDPIPNPTPAVIAMGKAPVRSSGAANAWSIMSVDLQRHLIFVPPAAPALTSTAACGLATTNGPIQ